MNVGLAKVMVFVGDVETCADWYATHFGLQKRAATHAPGEWCEVELGGGVTLAFHQAYDDAGRVARPTGGPGNPHKLVLGVDDVAAARAQLLAAGVTMFDPQSDHGVVRCDGLDCEEHRFQLVERGA